MNVYPHLQFRKIWELSADTQYLLGQCSAIVRVLGETPLPPETRRDLKIVSLRKGAQATTAIEGNTLSDAEVARVAEGESLPASKEYQEIEVKNVLDAMNVILREVASPEPPSLIDEALMLRFHKMIGQNLGEHLDAIPGRLREDSRIVGPYRCPDPADIRELLQKMCDWLRTDFRFAAGDQGFRDGVVQGIVTHVYFEWIHPFGDGNGRTGRLLEFYVLLRAGNPDIASHILSNFYNDTRTEYYRQLEQARNRRDLSSFLAYAIQGFRDGLVETLKTVQLSQFETAWKSYIYDVLADEKMNKKSVFKRRRQLVLKMPLFNSHTPKEMTETAPDLIRQYAPLTSRTIARDVDRLVQLGLVVATNDGRFRANTEILLQQMPVRRSP